MLNASLCTADHIVKQRMGTRVNGGLPILASTVANTKQYYFFPYNTSMHDTQILARCKGKLEDDDCNLPRGMHAGPLRSELDEEKGAPEMDWT
jgi:hypothetical protein